MKKKLTIKKIRAAIKKLDQCPVPDDVHGGGKSKLHIMHNSCCDRIKLTVLDCTCGGYVWKGDDVITVKEHLHEKSDTKTLLPDGTEKRRDLQPKTRARPSHLRQS